MFADRKKLARSFSVVLMLVLSLVLAVPAGANSVTVETHPFTTTVFGLAAAPDGSLLVADSTAGVVELRKGQTNLVAALPGVADVAPIGRGVMFALTGGGPDDTSGRLFRVSQGNVQEVANLMAYEAQVNPDNGNIDSNPYDVAVLSGNSALVADAAANALLVVDQNGAIDWVATFPAELVSTANGKTLIGCPNPPPFLADLCFLPDMIPAEAVSTSVAIGPDGAYYVGELKGFPGPLNESRVWRVEPGTRHADCAVSPACSVVLDGFTSIVDLAFGKDGMLYVVELDEASFLAVELPFFGLPPALQGGTVNACDLASGTCSEVATDLNLPIAAAVTKDGVVHVALTYLGP